MVQVAQRVSFFHDGVGGLSSVKFSGPGVPKDNMVNVRACNDREEARKTHGLMQSH